MRYRLSISLHFELISTGWLMKNIDLKNIYMVIIIVVNSILYELKKIFNEIHNILCCLNIY